MPRKNENPGYIVFFCFFMIIGSLFLLNLFVGVVINVFNKEKEKLSNSNLLTAYQDEYCEVLIKCYQSRPLLSVIKTGNKVRDSASKIVKSQVFETFIFICICSIIRFCVCARSYSDAPSWIAWSWFSSPTFRAGCKSIMFLLVYLPTSMLVEESWLYLP